MKKLKKILTAAVVLMSTGLLLNGCGNTRDAQNNETAAAANHDSAAVGTLRIVCTGFPQYDFVNQVLGENPAGIEVVYLLASGVDIHNYQASAEDMIKIKTSDLLLYTGGESEQWVDTLVQQTSGNRFKAMSLLEMVDAKEEVIVEGMEDDHDDEPHGDKTEEHEDEDHPGESVYDEHVWLSLRNSVRIVDAVCGAISGIDPTHEAIYQSNAAAYTDKLNKLDSSYEQVVREAKRDCILVADRFPFRYLADDYHLTYYAAFPGCSAETEASFETVVFLAEKVGELKLPSVFITDGSNGKIARTVIDNSRQKEAVIKTLNSIQSVSADDINSGVTYLGLMEENLILLKEALN